MASEEIKLSTNGKQLGKLRKISYIFQNLANFGPQTAEIILQVYPHSGSFRIFFIEVTQRNSMHFAIYSAVNKIWK